jgi:hypothetical protein
MPVWHVSASLWTPRGEQLRSPGVIERAAGVLLAEVGGGREWWLWNPRARIGHLRVALTAAENDLLPPFCGQVAYDAGDSGPERRRTRWWR